MHEPNAIWVASVYEKGIVIWQESLLGWEVEGNLKGRNGNYCNAVVSPPLKGRVIIV